MDTNQLRELIRTVLIDIDLYSEDAVELLMLTAAKESSLGFFLKQLGSGPALGIMQMEPETEKDIWANYLAYRAELKEKVFGYQTVAKNALWFNIGYQIAMCRVHYLRFPDPLPPHNDIHGMAAYWKKNYNTYQGKGTVQEAIEAYQRYCL